MIGLAVATAAILGITLYLRSKGGGFGAIFGGPPLYSGYGPGPTGPKSPPIGKASITGTLQDINSVVQGGDAIVMSGKKFLGDIKDIFGNEPAGIDEDYVNSLPVQ